MNCARRELLAAAGAIAAGAGVPAAARKAVVQHSGFLWGTATAAHQIEGNNVNSDFWVLEHIPSTYFKEPSGDACDSWNRWSEDLVLVKAGGLNAYRFSVEWARIEPERGEISFAALDHYRRICVAAREMGIEPVVTLHHFTSPRWIAAQGGWENPETAEDFARYASLTVKALGSTVDWICTMNEPNGQVTSKVMALGKPWKTEPEVLAQAAKAVGSDRWGAYFLGDSFKVRDVCLSAHVLGRTAIKSAAPHIKVGFTLALQENFPAPGGEALDKRVRDEARLPFYEAARNDDFVGVQTYNRGLIGPNGYLRTTDAVVRDAWDRDASPRALRAVVEEVHRATNRPIFVTEHGINTPDDALRVRHMRDSLSDLATAIDAGLPVIGYLHWSLLDNFEWSHGYDPKFGLVVVDRRTFRRTPKPSLAAYRALIADLRARHRWA